MQPPTPQRGKVALNKPLLAAMAVPAAGMLLMHAFKSGTNNDEQQAHQDIAQARGHEALRNAGDVEALRGGNGGSMKYLLAQRAAEGARSASYDDYPMDLFKEGSKIADQVGRAMAKQAGIGGAALGLLQKGMGAAKAGVAKVPGIGKSSGLGTKALVGAAALGTGYAALKGGQAAFSAAGAPAKVKVQGAGPALPRYVNQYGVPTQ